MTKNKKQIKRILIKNSIKNFNKIIKLHKKLKLRKKLIVFEEQKNNNI